MNDMMATSISSAKRKHTGSPNLDWAAHKSEIERLYIKENKNLNMLREVMSKTHGFSASKAQYEAQFKQWNFRKNASKTTQPWRYVFVKSKARREAGKKSWTYRHNKLVPDKTVQKELQRHISLSERYIPFEKLPDIPSECPEGFRVCTPPEMEIQSIRVDNLPWIQFRRILESNPELNNVGFDIAQFAREIPLCGVRASSPNEPSFGLDIFDTQDSLLADEFSLIGQKLRISPGVPSGRSSTPSRDPWALFQNAVADYRILSAEITLGGCAAAWDSQLGLSGQDPVTLLCRMFLYQSSNKRPDISIDPKDYTFFDWMLEHISPSILDALLSIRLPTSEACLEFLFEWSLISAKLELVRALIKQKRELLQALVHSTEFGHLFAHAIGLDDVDIVRSFLDAHGKGVKDIPLYHSRSPEMIEYLLRSGAEVNRLHSHYPFHLVTSVTWATIHGRTEVVQSLIGNNANVNIASFHMISPTSYKGPITTLRVATDRAVKALRDWNEDASSMNEGFRLIQILLEAGANPDISSLEPYHVFEQPDTLEARAKFTGTPLQVASRAGHISLCRLLLHSGADVNAPASPNGSTALVGAIESANCALVQLLIDHGALVNGPIHEEPVTTRTYLQLAIDRGQSEMVRMLLEAGADFNVTDYFGFTPLETAMMAPKSPDISHTLMRSGASMNSASRDKCMILRAILESDYTSVRRLLSDHVDFTTQRGFRSKLLQVAIDSGEARILSLLIQANLSMNEVFEIDLDDPTVYAQFGYPDYNFFKKGIYAPYTTPLNYAIAHTGLRPDARLSMLSIMLEAGANPNGTKLYQMACEATEVYCTVVEDTFKAALPLAVNLFMRKPSTLDVQLQYLQVIQLLLTKHAPADNFGQKVFERSLHDSLQRVASDNQKSRWPQSLEVARLLLENGADIISPGPDGTITLLEQAVLCGNVKLVQLLFERGADNAAGQRALTCAIFRSTEINSEAEENDLNAVTDILLANAADLSGALFEAVIVGHTQLAHRMIELGADHKDSLIAAAYAGDLEMARRLIERGANINSSGHRRVDRLEQGSTPLIAAAHRGRLDMVHFLINAGADTHLPGSQRYREAERNARDNGHTTVANLLKDRFEDATWH